VAFVSSLSFILLGLFAGVVLGILLRPRLEQRAFDALRRGLQVTALLVLNPLAFVGALWALPDLDPRLALLPVVGLATLAAAFLLGSLGARWGRLDPERALLFRTGTSYTNIGNLGGLSVFLLVGEAGYAVLPLYKLLEELWIYGFLFPHTKRGAQRLKASHQDTEGRWKALVQVARDPFVLVVLGAVALGLGLHTWGPTRPLWYGDLNAVLVPTSSMVLLASIGLNLKLSFSPRDLRPALGLTSIKVLVLPLVSLGLSGLAGFWALDAVWKTALILAVMPMAFLSLIPPTLYGLDEKFPATAWATTMVSLLVTLPVLNWVVTTF